MTKRPNLTEACPLFRDCSNKDKCWYCVEQNMFSPIKNKSYYRKLKKEKWKKEHPDDNGEAHKIAVKRGKSNKRNGKIAERKIEYILNQIGLNAARTPLSGALKASGLLPLLKDHMSGDIRITLPDSTELVVECKRNMKADPMYKMVEKPVKIEGFCVGMNLNDFQNWCWGYDVGKFTVIPDVRKKKLHIYFDQDNSDIVVVIKPYSDPIFFVQFKALKLLKGVVKK